MNERGFSLFELLIVIGLIVIVSVIILPSYRGFGFSNDLSVALNTVVQSLNQAQSLARSGDGDSDWGVKMESGRVTIFKGPSFVAFNAVSDQFFPISDTVAFSGLTQIVFKKFSGLPEQIGQIFLVSGIGSSRTVTVGAQGVISF